MSGSLTNKMDNRRALQVSASNQRQGDFTDYQEAKQNIGVIVELDQIL